jgi:hypothetical protein
LQTGKKLGAALGLSMLASVIHPAGVQSWHVILGFLNNRYLTSMINEARPPNFQELTFSLLFGLLLFSIFALATYKGKISTDRAILLTGFSAMTLFAARNIHLYCIVAPFVLAETLAVENKPAFLNKMEKALSVMEGQLRGIFWPIMTIIGFCVFTLRGNVLHQFNSESFPVDAVTWLEAHPQEGRMFNEISWGGYIAQHLWPTQLVFIDSIGDFEGDLTREYLEASSASGNWPQLFKKYDISWVIIPSTSQLAKALRESDDWVVLYEDHTAIIFRQQ